MFATKVEVWCPPLCNPAMDLGYFERERVDRVLGAPSMLTHLYYHQNPEQLGKKPIGGFQSPKVMRARNQTTRHSTWRILDAEWQEWISRHPLDA